MVWTDLAGLEYYHPNPQFGCYADPVFEPTDIVLQANNYDATGASTITVTITAYKPDGVTVLADVTANFNIYTGTFNISGDTYYFTNIKGNTFATEMITNGCFVLRVVVTADSTTVFDKFTQKYDLKNTAIFPSAITIGGVAADVCVPGSIENNCAFNYVKFKSVFTCIDRFSGDYYGEGTAISGTPFAFTRFSWLEGRIRPVVSEIQRTINVKGRVQRTQRIKKYLFTEDSFGGLPIWKVEEIEAMLLADNLYVDDTEYQYVSGNTFEQYGEPKGCEYRYRMKMEMQSNPAWQIFGCTPTCEDLATYYRFPTAFSRLYDDSMALVATTVDELKIYLASRPGYRSVQELQQYVPCQTYALLKTVIAGPVPTFFYVDYLVPSAKVFAKTLSANLTDFTALCNGIPNFNYAPQLGEIETEATPNYPPQIGGVETQSEDSYILQVTAAGSWVLDVNYSSGMNDEGIVTLNISVSQTTVTQSWINQPIANISGNGIPNNQVDIWALGNPNLPVNSFVAIMPDGEIQYTGPSLTSGGDQIIQFFSVQYNINN